MAFIKSAQRPLLEGGEKVYTTHSSKFLTRLHPGKNGHTSGLSFEAFEEGKRQMSGLIRPMTRFIADVMVGKLARWLRVLGFDVLYSNRYTDNEIVRIAEDEGRVILTRDARLAARKLRTHCLLIESVDYREQLRQVVRALGLKDFAVFLRCLECNAVLEDIDKESIFHRVPPYVYLTQKRFAICPSCRRVFWHGTHADEMLKRLGLRLGKT